MGTGAIFLNTEWLEANKEAFKKAYDDMNAKPEDKGTHLMINLDDLQQEGFKITNESMTIRALAVDANDEKKTLAYLTIDYDVDVSIQKKIADWLITKLARLSAAVFLLAQRDEQENP